MEELKKLEQVQKTLKLMHSYAFINDSSPDSNRFLANFILLLIQPCGNLNMDKKCQLLSDYFPKISAAFLEEASLCLYDEGMEPPESKKSWRIQRKIVQLEKTLNSERNERIEKPLPLVREDEAGISSLHMYSEDMAMVGFDSMQRANSTLEDFCRSYFMFHDLDANKVHSVFRYLPQLSFAESYIYQLDNLNEKLLQLPISEHPDHGGSAWGLSRNWILKSKKLFRTDPFEPLAALLQRHGLLTERIKEEFNCGKEYWSLERKLCQALTDKTEIPVEDVKRAIHLKSFDFRVLNLLLYQLRGEKDDVLENSFNILRMFVGIYGVSVAPSMLAKLITEAEEKYECLLKTLDPNLSLNYQKRCEEATKEGGKIFGPPLGTWTIPHLIEGEDLYRNEIKNTRPAVLP